MPRLHETGIGQNFFLNHIPRFIKAIEKLGQELEALNKNLAQEENKEEQNEQ